MLRVLFSSIITGETICILYLELTFKKLNSNENQFLANNYYTTH